jgi:OOP family OmpA-OmpF porin
MRQKVFLRVLLFAVIAAVAAGGAQAGAFVGLSAGQGSTEISQDATGFEGSSNAFKLFGGYRFIRFFGVEADYRDFGTSDDTVLGTNIEVGTTSLDVFAVGTLPLGAFELFGKAGFARWDAEFSVPGEGSFDNDGNDMAYGIGAAYKINKIAVRVEYEQFEVEDTDVVSMASVGVGFRF